MQPVEALPLDDLIQNQQALDDALDDIAHAAEWGLNQQDHDDPPVSAFC